MSKSIPPILSNYLAAIGAVGGAVKSPAKTKACIANARKPRKGQLRRENRAAAKAKRAAK